MIKPNPFVYKYTSCSWKKIIAPKSDALGPFDYHKTCPNCGCDIIKKELVKPFLMAWFSLKRRTRT